MQPTQMQMFYTEQRKLGDRNIQFLEMVKDGLTREELRAPRMVKHNSNKEY